MRCAKCRASRVIDESRRHGEVAGPKSSCNDAGFVLGDKPTQTGCLMDEIVSDDRAAHPGGISREVPRGAVLHAHPSIMAEPPVGNGGRDSRLQSCNVSLQAVSDCHPEPDPVLSPGNCRCSWGGNLPPVEANFLLSVLLAYCRTPRRSVLERLLDGSIEIHRPSRGNCAATHRLGHILRNTGHQLPSGMPSAAHGDQKLPSW